MLGKLAYLAYMFQTYPNTIIKQILQGTTERLLLLLLTLLSLSGCVDEDFIQEDALAIEAELEGKAPAGPDSVWVVPGRHYDRSVFHRFFWGDHNREIWATPVKLPVFKLDSIKGGLKVVDKGGGFQTTSFELQDSAGRLWAFRSVDKDPVEVVPPFWRKTFVANVLRDQMSAANPYGALIVPVLAEAVGVHHSHPEMYYVPRQDESFGEYAPDVQGKVFMLEEKYKKPPDITTDFPLADDFVGTEKALRLRFESNTNHFAQKEFARARLLDLLVGDWDRHKGQWEWAVQKKGADTYFVPIPKDRDQVFLEMGDGLIPAIATSKLLVRKFHSYDDDFSDVKAYMINAEFVDERFLHELSLQEWQQIAKDIQVALTDEVIEKAVRQLPAPIYSLTGESLQHNLKSRRDLLLQAANRMYSILAKEVTVAGSDEEEHFFVNRLDNSRTEVTVRRPASNGIPPRQLYHRIFFREETDQIILRGLADDDVFLVKGNVDDAIPLRIYGGLGEDNIADSSSVAGLKKMTKIYDTERGNEIYFGSEAQDRTTRDVRVHAYDREGN
ncbi:hypothetical protein [Pontibacter pamirensis]|uniref:hypothetical protein n=1 Tax=Pontibacter pamirensis TaxID=2562824 RepID=UPI00138A509A|nr:hypothetical protein [Pontibacter pamirensis]